MQKRSLVCPVIWILVMGSVYGQSEMGGEAMPPPIQEEKKFSTPNHMFPVADEVSGSKLVQQREKYLSTRGWRLGFTKKGSYLGWGEASINLPPDDLRFGQKRLTSFEKAFADAKGEYVRAKKRRTTTSTIRKLFHDDSDPSPADVLDRKSSLEVIGEKLTKLTEANLDARLLEEGIDPTEIANKSVKQKRKLARDAIARKIMVNAVESVTGVRVLATFEDLTSVGALIVCSDEMRQIAQALAHGKTVGLPPKGDPRDAIAEQINSKAPKDVDLAFVHGVRVMTDDNGDRALVAFGQWAPQGTRNDSRMKQSMAIKAAREIAYNQADGALTDFIRSTTALTSRSKIEDSDSIDRLMRADSQEDVESVQVSSRNFLFLHRFQ